MRRTAWLLAFLCGGTVQSAHACAGAIPVNITFDPGSSMLTTTERSRLDAAVREARAAARVGGLNVALAIYSQREAGGNPDLKRLTEQRVRTLREGFATLGLEPSAVVAVLGDSTTQKAPWNGSGGLAEIEIAFGCGG